ncbi:uncharacterized protein LOC103709764 [Phoenix dactylifera]|uniref:Uncharacterized protein LOC103709764 n=1 Tax=Phoenix dactylifera TaxID=42345 RepID=A0A8B7C7L7_PHODC|nr:uncharacterized protein LOC103709764 [Phoenix dactylifera]
MHRRIRTPNPPRREPSNVALLPLFPIPTKTPTAKMRRTVARSLLLKSISTSCPSPKPSSSSLPRIPAKPPKSSRLPLPTSATRPLCRTFLPNPSPHARNRAGDRREFSAGELPTDHSKEVDEINLKFAEAREEIEAALESKETVYFDEEAECAREAAKVVLEMFEGLLARLPEKERTALQRSMGLKIEQLKAELKQLDD